MLAPYLSDSIGIPVVASMPLLGIILGPQVLGLIEPNMLLQFMGALGMIYVFFSSGAEINLTAFRKHARPILIFGSLTFIIPFAFGFAFGKLLFGKSLLSAIFMGAFFASSGSFAVQRMFRNDLLARDSAEIGRGGAGVSRLLVAIIIFALGLAPPEGSLLEYLRTFGLPALYFLCLWLIVPKLASIALRRSRAQSSTDAIAVLLIVFLCAAVAPLAGVEGYLGAFIAGILIYPSITPSKAVVSRLDVLGNSLFLPFFLIFIGLSADFSRIPTLVEAIALILGSAALGLGSKFLASFFASKALGYSAADRGLLFGFSSTFAAFSLAIASVAGNSGRFDQPLVSGAIILVIVSSLLTSFVARNSGSSIYSRKSSPPEGKPSEGQRIVVALSKPSTAHMLMDLGITLHGQSGSNPLYPMAVVQDTDLESESRQHAETMLAAATMLGVGAQVPVIPVSRIAANIAEGVLECAREQHADTIILGWNKPPKLSNAFFGSVIDQTIAEGNQMVVVSRSMSAMTESHIVAIVPALCDRHPGFGKAVRAIDAIARKNQARTHIVTLKGHGQTLVKEFKSSGFSQPGLLADEIESWKDIGSALKRLQSGPKLFILLSARPSEPSWHPAIERLPHRIGEEYPESNLIMIYLESLATDRGTPNFELELSGQDESLRQAVRPKHASTSLLEMAIARGTVRVHMEHAAITDAIFELVSSAFPFDRKVSSRLGARLTEIVQRQPIEIEPGVVLIHDRVDGLASPIICLGSHRQGFRVSLLDKLVKVVIILLVPEKESPEDHLAFLGDIAHLFKDKGLAHRLLEVETPEELLSTPPAFRSH